MPRRMITPEIWYNEKFTSQTDTGRLLFIGIFSNADDDGRLKASAKYLKAHIFPYDEDKKLDLIQQLRDELNKSGLINVYSTNGKEYLELPGWREHQLIRKDRYKTSPIPPFDNATKPLYETEEPDSDQKTTNGIPDDTPLVVGRGRSLSQSKSSQSSLIKFNISQLSQDFSEVKSNDKDLTDRLTLTFIEYTPAGRQKLMEVVKALWGVFDKKLDSNSFGIIYDALGKYEPVVLAKTLVKAVHYSTDKRKPANYIKKILEEKSENNK